MSLEGVTLTGKHVRLEPLTPQHLDAFCAIGLEDSVWRWSPTPVHNRAEMAAYINAALRQQEAGVALPFATVALSSGAVVGSTRFGNIEMQHKRVEIGWTWLSPPWQGTGINTEAKLLMLTHAFEHLGCIRVELKTDALNARSRTAIVRLGARREGIHRKHMICTTGRVRDTVFFSILDTDWPTVKTRLEGRIQHAFAGQ